MGSVNKGIHKVCFEPHMSLTSVIDQSSSIFIGVKVVVGKVPHQMLRLLFVRVMFIPSLFFYLLLTYKNLGGNW